MNIAKVQTDQARYYNPSTGRWLSEDPIGSEGGMNLYGYVKSNPVGYKDSSGEKPTTAAVCIAAYSTWKLYSINQYMDKKLNAYNQKITNYKTLLNEKTSVTVKKQIGCGIYKSVQEERYVASAAKRNEYKKQILLLNTGASAYAAKVRAMAYGSLSLADFLILSGCLASYFH